MITARSELSLARYNLRLVFGLRSIVYLVTLAAYLYYAVVEVAYASEAVDRQLFPALFLWPFSLLLALWTVELVLVDQLAHCEDLLRAEVRPAAIIARRFLLALAFVLVLVVALAVSLVWGGDTWRVLWMIPRVVPPLLFAAAVALFCAAAARGYGAAVGSTLFVLVAVDRLGGFGLPAAVPTLTGGLALVGTSLVQLVLTAILAYYGVRMIETPRESQ